MDENLPLIQVPIFEDALFSAEEKNMCQVPGQVDDLLCLLCRQRRPKPDMLDNVLHTSNFGVLLLVVVTSVHLNCTCSFTALSTNRHKCYQYMDSPLLSNHLIP